MIRYEAFINPDWKESGCASIVLGKFAADGAVTMGYAFVDTFCLGVREAAFVEGGGEADFRADLDAAFPEEPPQRIHPACAKKLIEGAIAYAEKLGFAPHRDYRKVRRLLAHVDAAACTDAFPYGREGRPCFIPLEDDSPERIDRVLRSLVAKLGEDGFDYIDPEVEDEAADADADAGTLVEETAEEWDEDAEARDTLADLLADEDAPHAFEHFSGLVLGALASPIALTQLALLPLVPQLRAQPWRDAATAEEFLAALQRYWDASGELLARALDDPSGEDSPVDLLPWDFPDQETFTAGGTAWARGFLDLVAAFPDSWASVRQEPRLAPDWDTLEAAADPAHPRHAAVVADLVGDPGKAPLLGAAVTRIARRARPTAPSSAD